MRKKGSHRARRGAEVRPGTGIGGSAIEEDLRMFRKFGKGEVHSRHFIRTKVNERRKQREKAVLTRNEMERET